MIGFPLVRIVALVLIVERLSHRLSERRDFVFDVSDERNACSKAFVPQFAKLLDKLTVTDGDSLSQESANRRPGGQFSGLRAGFYSRGNGF
jgi:hypothetical protein